MDVHPSSVSFVASWYFGGGVVDSDAADFGFPCMYCSLELVDAASGFHEALVGDCAAALNRHDETVSDGSCGVSEGVVLHAEDGRS